jgi:hypothetical protein
MPDNQNANQADMQPLDEIQDQTRRDAMKKIGKYAVYTAPAMLTLLASKKSMALPISL